MASELTHQERAQAVNEILANLGQVANEVAASHVFDDFRERKAANTIRRHDADLALFAEYLADVGAVVGDLATDPNAWTGITWGLVSGFQKWQLAKGYAVSTVNLRLSTVKTYARLAMQAGELDASEYAVIKSVAGFSRKEGKRINGEREARDVPTRLGTKKREPVSISKDQAAALKAQPDTPQGRRDALIMHLLLDLGLRVGEVAALQVGNFDLKAGTVTFYRAKVDKEQTHDLINGTLAAARAYIEQDALAAGPLLRGSRKDGRLQDAGMNTRSITQRVKVLGEAVGLEGLSAHDCRHYWATRAAAMGTPLDRLQDAGGWSSPAMPLRYIEAAKIANQGVNL